MCNVVALQLRQLHRSDDQRLGQLPSPCREARPNLAIQEQYTELRPRAETGRAVSSYLHGLQVCTGRYLVSVGGMLCILQDSASGICAGVMEVGTFQPSFDPHRPGAQATPCRRCSAHRGVRMDSVCPFFTEGLFPATDVVVQR